MNQVLFSVAEVSKMIKAGKALILAGDEKSLQQLPAGTWIGGTIPYFMGEQGGEFNQDKIYVTTLPAQAADPVIRIYDDTSIANVYTESPEWGFSIIIIPATSKTHQAFSLNAPTYKGFASRPLIGWISGVDLKALGKTSPKVFDGRNGQAHENQAVVLSAALPKGQAASIEIINMFEPGQGETLQFEADGFSARNVLVNGKSMNFVEYLKQVKADTKLPLVANYHGAHINISFQAVDEAGKKVDFYAPVFKGVNYQLAKPMGDYIGGFNQVMGGSKEKSNIFFACNCILNYLYSELEGKKTGNITGPITFGEIAYQLLNQTLVYMTIEKLA